MGVGWIWGEGILSIPGTSGQRVQGLQFSKLKSVICGEMVRKGKQGLGAQAWSVPFGKKQHPGRDWEERGRSPTLISESLLGQEAQRGKFRGQTGRWSLFQGCGGGAGWGVSQDRSSGH